MQLEKSHIRVNDQVEIIAGKDKGRVGKVLKVHHKTSRVVVEKVNMVKRHTKPSAVNQQGGIIEKEAAVHVSNVLIICPKCTKTVRVGNKMLDDGQKVRFCKKCGEAVEFKA
ncbi:MAG: 50S ribosomal protein L24 [Deltaproteobacteria bacterium CG_4_10_14_3_um_filter_60_8]|nr:MAG: 50S ribosomal protein L24 [Desulfobacterales bacterium CG2_30_60_27]PIP43961.1 MAG: 50S ribosomal protein L24 [Deltaproteobacteria bacterium CG23_combo_of_CG06-09_8_20_14_all_60_8]PIY20854.1 MAG: 50S ribosomal protein L24 [Deltaproteobacteria bacterium CG_4_10_14_3_um_filter_60_8]